MGGCQSVSGRSRGRPLRSTLWRAADIRTARRTGDLTVYGDECKFGGGKVLRDGLRTPDIHSEGTRKVGTREMGDAVRAYGKAMGVVGGIDGPAERYWRTSRV